MQQKPDGPSGVGGWMQWFIFTWIIAIILDCIQAIDASGLAKYLLWIFVALRCCFSAYGFAAIGNRYTWTPRFWAIFIICTATLNIILVAVSSHMGLIASAQTGDAIGRLVLSAAVWTAYWAMSRRVKNTFGSTAFSASVERSPQ